MRYSTAWIAALAGALCSPAFSADLFSDSPETLLRGESLSIEPLVGYLRGTSGEYVYNVPGNHAKASQLDWKVDALAVGGRLAIRPLGWLTVRGRFWATVASGGEMTDRDWFAGYFGPNSWTHKSESPDTKLAKAWQADVSAAIKIHDGENLAVTAIGGYRQYDIKYRAAGGTYVYSERGFRDSIGTLPSDVLGISYEQTWKTPYAGFGVVYNDANWTASGEMIGSPFVKGRDRDYHALRTTLFKENFELSGMVGASLGIEYRISEMLSLAGRLEYQKYFEAKGGTQLVDGSTGTAIALPKPAAGADAETILLTVGLKARL